MPTQNDFRYRGALGGLVAADERLREQRGKELDNQAQALLNVNAALELDLARKYGDRKMGADTRAAEALARSQTAEATVAENTVDARTSHASNQARTSGIQADMEQQRIQSGINANNATSNRQNTAARIDAQKAPWEIEALQAKTFASNAQANASMYDSETSRMQVEGLVSDRKEKNRISRDELAVRTTEADAKLSYYQAQIEAGQADNKIKEEANRLMALRVNLEESKLRLAEEAQAIDRTAQSFINMQRLAAARLDEAKASGEGSLKGLTGEKLDNNLGIFDANAQIADVLSALDSSKGGKILLDATKSKQSAEGTLAHDTLTQLLNIYRHGAPRGHIPVMSPQELRSVMLDAADLSLFGGGKKMIVNSQDAGYRRYWAAALGHIKASEYSPGTILQLKKEADARGIPLHPAYAFLYSTLTAEGWKNRGKALYEKRNKK